MVDGLSRLRVLHGEAHFPRKTIRQFPTITYVSMAISCVFNHVAEHVNRTFGSCPPTSSHPGATPEPAQPVAETLPAGVTYA